MFKHTVLCSHRFGQKKIGVDNTPHIIKKYLNPEIKTHNIEKLPNNLFKSLASIYHTNQKISGKRINIGGDHSITIGTGAYSLNKYKNTKFIWVDAHPDINTYTSSFSKNFHGMPLGYLTGLSKHDKIPYIKNHVPFSNILYIGIRDIDPFEFDVIQDNGIQYIPSSICNKNMKSTMSIIQEFAKDSPVHLSFDVDCLDPKYVAATGTPVNNGLELDVAKKLVQYIVHNYDVLNIDICELNLSIGSKEETKKSLHNVLDVWEGIL